MNSQNWFARRPQAKPDHPKGRDMGMTPACCPDQGCWAPSPRSRARADIPSLRAGSCHSCQQAQHLGNTRTRLLESTNAALSPWENACSLYINAQSCLLKAFFLLSSLTHSGSLDPMQYPTQWQKTWVWLSFPAEPAELWESLKLT